MGHVASSRCQSRQVQGGGLVSLGSILLSIKLAVTGGLSYFLIFHYYVYVYYLYLFFFVCLFGHRHRSRSGDGECGGLASYQSRNLRRLLRFDGYHGKNTTCETDASLRGHDLSRISIQNTTTELPGWLF